MITKWKAFNFKSICKETELQIAPLTIFAGANSSGKSTFLQSILLVAQTLAHMVSSRSVVLNGALARLGQFDDLRSAGSEADQIVIAWTCQPVQPSQIGSPSIAERMPRYYGRGRDALSSVACEFSFDTEEAGSQREITQIQPRLFSTQLTALTRDTDGGDRRSSLAVRRSSGRSETSKQKWLDATDSGEPWARPSLQYDVELDSDSLAEIHEEVVSAQPVGCLFRHFLPARLSLGVDLVAEDIRTILGVLTADPPRGMSRRYYPDREIPVPASIIDFILNSAGAVGDDLRRSLSAQLHKEPSLLDPVLTSLEELQDALRRTSPRLRLELRKRISEREQIEKFVDDHLREDRGEEPAVIPFRLPAAIAEASGYLSHFFSTNVRYLGPLRDEPKSLYPLAPTADPSDVGLKGEHTAAVLELHKNRPVRYIPTSSFTGDQVSATPITRTLETAVVDWLQYLGVAESVQSHDKGKFGHELLVSIEGSKRYHDLTHVGVGVSQVLPILVVSLLSQPDTTFIFEQPELHLHPKVQTRLADFFLSLTKLEKQCLLETHSEYLVNRIRFRTAAADMNNPWLQAVKLYFVERHADKSSFHEVRMNEFGAIPDWPDGFFDQSQREAEAILRAATLKRKSRRER